MDWVVEGKTKVGEIDFKLAAAACYLPVAMINLVAAVVFLITEPKEHRFVRFHAVQSLLMYAFFVVGSLAAVIVGMVVVPAIVLVVGSIVESVLRSASPDLGMLVMNICGFLAFASYMLGALIGVGMALAFLPAFAVNLVLVLTGKVGRWPVFGSLAERFV